MNEKRQAVRWRVALPVRYAGLNTPTEGVCKTQDISTLGARLAMVEKHRAGDRLDMIVDIPHESGGSFCVEADVIWQRAVRNLEEECNYLTGVVFRRILECHKNSLLEYISANYPQEFRCHWWEGV